MRLPADSVSASQGYTGKCRLRIEAPTLTHTQLRCVTRVKLFVSERVSWQNGNTFPLLTAHFSAIGGSGDILSSVELPLSNSQPGQPGDGCDAANIDFSHFNTFHGLPLPNQCIVLLLRCCFPQINRYFHHLQEKVAFTEAQQRKKKLQLTGLS